MSIYFSSDECFRRPSSSRRVGPVNKALFDVNMMTVATPTEDTVKERRSLYRERYLSLFENDEFVDLISKSVDHRSRTKRRHDIWEAHFAPVLA